MTMAEHLAQPDKTDATRAGLPTPPPLTEAAPPPVDENMRHDELVAKCKELQASNVSLRSQVSNLQAQNIYWLQIYDYIEKGLAVKVKEMDVLVQENQRLKETNTRLSQQLQERSIKPKMDKPKPDELVAPIVLKQLRHLQDQVRARDLVIDLLKKAEQERAERELKDKLDQQRQELEVQLGLSAHASPSALTVPTATKEPVRSVRSGTRGGKSAAKVGGALQVRKTAGVKRKRPTTRSETSTSIIDEDPVGTEEETVSQDKCRPVDTQREVEEVADAVDKAPFLDTGEGNSLLEKEVDQALEELFNE